MKPEFVVCVPTSLANYLPPFEAEECLCDSCEREIWLPVDVANMPAIKNPEAEFLCISCFAGRTVRNDVAEDSVVHFVGMENWVKHEAEYSLLSQQQLDQEMAWAEENLPMICRTALKVFPKHEDLFHRLIWRMILLLVWHVLQGRWNRGLLEESIFERWTDSESNAILEFLMWQPKPLEKIAGATNSHSE
jgi:hypothetical protein